MHLRNNKPGDKNSISQIIVATDAQQLEQDPIIDLFELDARKYGEGVLHWCNETLDGQSVRFNGYTYQPLSIEARGFKWSRQVMLLIYASSRRATRVTP